MNALSQSKRITVPGILIPLYRLEPFTLLYIAFLNDSYETTAFQNLIFQNQYRDQMKKAIVISWLCLLAIALAVFFWQNELKYNLPTPVPKNYKEVVFGSVIPNANKWGKGKPVFLHFFNPDCPCSRFNIPHFKTLVKQYGNEVDFMIVPVSNKNFTEKEIQEKFGLALPVLTDNSIAAACGVYATPQAVLIDNKQRLFYKGNYNRSRYCTDKKTEYAKMALDSFIHNNHQASYDLYALTAYGCELPTCTK